MLEGYEVRTGQRYQQNPKAPEVVQRWDASARKGRGGWVFYHHFEDQDKAALFVLNAREPERATDSD